MVFYLILNFISVKKSIISKQGQKLFKMVLIAKCEYKSSKEFAHLFCL